MTDDFTRRVVDRARELWTVEAASHHPTAGVVLRYRHEMGYELTAVAPRSLENLSDGELVKLLEEVRRRPPRVKLSTAA